MRAKVGNKWKWRERWVGGVYRIRTHSHNGTHVRVNTKTICKTRCYCQPTERQTLIFLKCGSVRCLFSLICLYECRNEFGCFLCSSTTEFCSQVYRMSCKHFVSTWITMRADNYCWLCIATVYAFAIDKCIIVSQCIAILSRPNSVRSISHMHRFLQSRSLTDKAWTPISCLPPPGSSTSILQMAAHQRFGRSHS